MLPDDLAIIHQPNRLKVMALLHDRGDIGAAGARKALDMSAGNLDAHAKKLAEAGLLEARKVLRPDGFEARYRITKEGMRRFRAYLDWLETFLAAAR